MTGTISAGLVVLDTVIGDAGASLRLELRQCFYGLSPFTWSFDDCAWPLSLRMAERLAEAARRIEAALG